MNDTMFITRLSSVNLLSINTEVQVKSKPTQESKAKCFLDHAIRPSLMIVGNSNFNELLKVMDSSTEYGDVKKLAKLITTRLREVYGCSFSASTLCFPTYTKGVLCKQFSVSL